MINTLYDTYNSYNFGLYCSMWNNIGSSGIVGEFQNYIEEAHKNMASKKSVSFSVHIHVGFV